MSIYGGLRIDTCTVRKWGQNNFQTSILRCPTKWTPSIPHGIGEGTFELLPVSWVTWVFRPAPARGHVPSILRSNGTWGPDSYRLRINGKSVLTIEEG